mmetsp:Transcript_9535/g.24477  ORF Transcript_9535/g.24477 Transcript_9535/m.24477 type:complete len:224 (+) Transcript_9535:740-1411(+)
MDSSGQSRSPPATCCRNNDLSLAPFAPKEKRSSSCWMLLVSSLWDIATRILAFSLTFLAFFFSRLSRASIRLFTVAISSSSLSPLSLSLSSLASSPVSSLSDSSEACESKQPLNLLSRSFRSDARHLRRCLKSLLPRTRRSLQSCFISSGVCSGAFTSAMSWSGDGVTGEDEDGASSPVSMPASDFLTLKVKQVALPSISTGLSDLMKSRIEDSLKDVEMPSS